jgi:general secretion pathway protein C
MIAMKRRWVWDILVLSLIVYFAVDALISVLDAKLAPKPGAEISPVKSATRQSGAFRPLEEYGIISKRNLFGGGAQEPATVRPGEIDLAQIPLALNSLGLKLVGTVVSGSPAEELAIIEDLGTHKQELYHQGDRVKQALIKRILRENVIINTGAQDEMLTMKPEESPEQAPTSVPFPRPSTPAAATSGPVRMERQEIESSFADLNQLMQQVRIRPYMEENKPAGFLLTDIRAGSIFAKMGLRDGDVIQRVNDRTITSTEQAMELYQGLMQGGEIALEIKRGRRIEEIHYDIR